MFIGMEVYKHHSVFIFASNNTDIRGDGYVRVSVVAKGMPQFLYTMYDPQTNTIRHFKGDTGDPDKDSYEILSAGDPADDG